MYLFFLSTKHLTMEKAGRCMKMSRYVKRFMVRRFRKSVMYLTVNISVLSFFFFS
ncbi:hypothetical protein KFK09_017825 [Dendrobium nobile]|uniref:Uncharacterized protein n=1 Tax=Dendrobium nobile TaxID=94219 RepID=A0A8T3ATI8_DENNO|nr:hypothetical protein KFK09_017825 [Dendrobium nobile]